MTVDPGTSTLYPTRDTYVDSQQPSTSFEGNTQLRVKWTDSSARYPFIRFDTGSLVATDRLVYTANLTLKATGSGSAPTVKAKRPNQDWPTGSMTWNNKPAVATQVFWSGAVATGIVTIPLPSLYQGYLDGAWTDRGVRLDSSDSFTERVFVSSEGYSVDRPKLVLTWNDLPDDPVLDAPGAGALLETDSPTLSVTGTPADPNGDDVLLRYQVSDSSSDFTGTHVQWESGWTDQESFAVPAGILTNGRFWWRVQARDVCQPPATLCSLTDGAGVVRDAPASDPQAFTVALQYLGGDGRYATWSQTVGNDMSLAVNQANGNLYVNLPLDTLATPGGELGLSLIYNHQQEDDLGLGPGWGIAAGPLSADLPVALSTPSGQGIEEGQVVAIRFSDGRETWFTRRTPTLFQAGGAGTGLVRLSAEGTYRYLTAGGDLFLFGADGLLARAIPAPARPAIAPAFTYSFDGSGHLAGVEDAIGRTVDLAWNGGRLEEVTTWDDRTWVLTYDGGHLATVTNPASGTVTLSHDGSGFLSEVLDGKQSADEVPGWGIEYGGTPGDPLELPRVQEIAPPVPAGATWQFDYVGPFHGTVASQAKVTDPRGVATTGIPGDYQKITDFSRAGLPVRIAGPADQHGYWPLTTLVWDSNGTRTGTWCAPGAPMPTRWRKGARPPWGPRIRCPPGTSTRTSPPSR
ncbi:MAG: DNRLRE domain-containing protein [Actinomycetota bacterium]